MLHLIHLFLIFESIKTVKRMKSLSKEDICKLKAAGIDPADVENQLKVLTSVVKAPELVRTATLDDGIQLYTKAEEDGFQTIWKTYLEKGKPVYHFIPASGSASRFFKDLYAFLKAPYVTPQTNFEKNFFKHLSSFAFYNELNRLCIEKEGKEVSDLMEVGKFKLIVEYLLTDKGLNYCQLPHALFKFHTDKSKTFTAVAKYLPKKFFKYYSSWEDTRTPIQESLIESAMVSGVKGGIVNVCYTIQKGDRDVIQDYVREFKQPIEKKFGVQFYITLPIQSTETDTVTVDEKGEVKRDSDGNIKHCPSGHGALFLNLNQTPADVIFIKNIDNEASDSLKKLTSGYKRVLGGILIFNFKQIKKFLRMLDKDDVPDDKLIEIINYVENTLNVKRQSILRMPREEQIEFLRTKLNRPLRVCGMVKNEDEQGGMPCWVKNPDGTISLQIVEYYEVNEHPELLKIFNASTHFNPVDMACCVTDYKGKKFDLSKFANPDAWILCKKQNPDGTICTHLDRPGLWNGCMADWNTIFVEVPIKTFNPVKNINDLLRQEHQN